MEIKIFTDGGSRGNPGESAVGVVVYDEEGKMIWEKGKAVGVGTNNEAEYSAVLLALEWVKKTQNKIERRTSFALGSLISERLPSQKTSVANNFESVSFYLDSKLVVEQLSKRWKIKEPRMRALAEKCWAEIEEMELKVSFTHIPREENERADELVNAALDAKML